MPASAARRARREQMDSSTLVADPAVVATAPLYVWHPRSAEDRYAEANRRAQEARAVSGDIAELFRDETTRGPVITGFDPTEALRLTKPARAAYARDVRGARGDGSWDNHLDCSGCAHALDCPGDKCRRQTSAS